MSQCKFDTCKNEATHYVDIKLPTHWGPLEVLADDQRLQRVFLCERCHRTVTLGLNIRVSMVPGLMLNKDSLIAEGRLDDGVQLLAGGKLDGD